RRAPAAGPAAAHAASLIAVRRPAHRANLLRGHGITVTRAGRRSAPGPGRPVVAASSGDDGRGMQNVAASTAVPPSVAGVPLRVIVPSSLLGKHGVDERSE